MSVHEIEVEITKLPASEVAALLNWLADYHHAQWDKQIEDDLEAGRLDRLISEVDAECDAGLAQPL